MALTFARPIISARKLTWIFAVIAIVSGLGLYSEYTRLRQITAFNQAVTKGDSPATDKQSYEAKFATAVDRFQPMLLNCRTEGAAWNRHGVTQDRVIARNRHIAEGCAELWRYAEKMVQDAVNAGHLKATPQP